MHYVLKPDTIISTTNTPGQPLRPARHGHGRGHPRRRAELGLSQADLAKAAGVDARQIRRYEAGQQQPVLSVAVAIANALGISVSELAGAPSHRVSLTGDWWTCWQTARGDVEDIRTQPVHLDQHGELRLWDNEILLGGMPPATARSAPKAPCTSSCTPRHPRRRPMGRD